MSTSPKPSSGSAAANATPSGPDWQDNLRRLDRLANVGLISASIAHEIKNGLVAVKTYAEIMLEKGDDTEMAELVRRELARIDGLATQMLRLSSPRAAAHAGLRVHPVLDHCLRLLEHQMNSRMIALKRDYCAVPDTVRGDESQLQQAFMNLILNGVEAIGNGGELTVRTETAPGGHGARQLQISFQDTGPGIRPENLARLFEPFFTTKKHGTGLGLAITRRVAEDHQGKIEAVNAPERGAVFILTLPAE
jgi:two-component system, NtrC family, sensor histidine kinase HydH